LPRADAARSSSRLLASVSSDSMNGYRKLVLSVLGVAGTVAPASSDDVT
jgi:hypothetical protein